MAQPSKTTIRTIAGELISAKKSSGLGATVILGAGASINSGVPSWPALARRICEDQDLDLAPFEGPIECLVDYFGTESAVGSNRYHLLEPYLVGKRPSTGYMHLAELAKQGLIRVVLTTNWDSLLETAFYRLMPAERIKVLVRGEVSDELIARVLDTNTRGPVIIKLHGDVATRLFLMTPSETGAFDPGILSALHRLLDGFTIMVGQSAQDVDLLGTLLTRPGSAQGNAGHLFHVRYESGAETERVIDRAGVRVVEGERAHVLNPGVTVNIGDFDGFFTQLSLAVQLKELNDPAAQKQRAKVQQAILDKERKGLGYINYTTITRLVQNFTHKVLEFEPDLVFFINDPSAPGGPELKRHMQSGLEDDHIEIAEIVVEGEENSRTFNRRVKSDTPDTLSHPDKTMRRILILDSITFSGNTLALARERAREWYPKADVRTGVLVISQQLVEREEELTEHVRTIHETITDRYEIFFPWGVTQTTSAFNREFVGLLESERRMVKIDKRPWGAIEILADQETASVRLLTIEAHGKLSFQRHLCRDELFVALDDNIGLEICSEDLNRDADQYDPRIASLILEKGDYILIPRGIWHRTKASMDRVRLLEVAFGVYDQTYDIERLWDDYRREGMDGGR
ncbi:hypothetical protein GCM10027176_36860 [Actinoallomurus bryophytorum]|uniref:Mannose-6-phosphate isomerase-like protein (Cupin superfamily) n=1 Tax=Actinoallomurus bryophytorum TaxID=1490222 RepID=A0A543CIT0_9ACTN|nr:SIR2 family protein [Actinoallomurus bryophytorum]TQL97012.1 mannose-6-phosphate isomerase-like protein (cupin superfamily) [Actinoallomurus bryophytorum]